MTTHQLVDIPAGAVRNCSSPDAFHRRRGDSPRSPSAMRRQVTSFRGPLLFHHRGGLFPLGVGPEPDLLRKLAPRRAVGSRPVGHHAVLTLVRRRSSRLAPLEQLALAPHPLGLVVLGKVIAHWLVSGSPCGSRPHPGAAVRSLSAGLWVLTGSILWGPQPFRE